MKAISVRSSKKGVGKTCIAINLAAALASLGNKTLLIDSDFSSPNVALSLGVDQLPYYINDSLAGKVPPSMCTYVHPSGLNMMLADHRRPFSDRFSLAISGYDFVIIDSDNIFADEAIIVADNDPLSLGSAKDAVLKSEEEGTTVLGVILNRTDQGNIEDISLSVGSNLLGSLPHSEMIVNNNPIVYEKPNSYISQTFIKLASDIKWQTKS